LSAILNKYYSFTQPFGPDWTLWYIRESSTALIVANLPLTWPLIRRIFKVKAFNDESSDHTAPSRQPASRMRFTLNRRQSGSRNGNTTVDQSSSQEQINKGANGVPLQIYRQQEVEVRSRRASEEESRVSNESMGYVTHGVSATVRAALRRELGDADTVSMKSSSSIVRGSPV
jgi:hypothetical protein